MSIVFCRLDGRMWTETDMHAVLLILALFVANLARFPQEEVRTPVPLMVADDSKPHVLISWATADGRTRVLEGDRAWGADGDRTALGANISAYAAVGGTRLTMGAGHPKGAIVRVGFYKIDPGESFFEGIGAESVVRVEMRGIRFNQSARPIGRTILQHLKFAREALVSCRIASDAWSLYNTADREDTLNGRARTGYDTRPGALSGQKPGDGSATAVVEDDGSITLRAQIPYALFKHIRDPWLRAIPGTFLEPMHFHVEVEVLPEGVEERAVTADD